MGLNPSKGLKVKVKASREAVFGEEGVSVSKLPDKNGERPGVMTGMTLAGFAEIEMPGLDGKKHWYPVEELSGENGEQIVEETMVIAEENGEEAE